MKKYTMRKITTIIWDMDGTLYRDTPEIKGVFKKAACAALRDVVDPALDDDQAMNMITESRKKNGDSFSAIVQDHGVNASVLHERHHANLNTDRIERDEKAITALRRAKQNGIRHAILTHGHMNWVEKVLHKTGLDDIFDRTDIISNELIDFIKKHTGPDAFEKALAWLEVKPEQSAVIEDKASNLKHAHEMGMLTIQVHYGQIDEQSPKPDYVDFRCATPEDAVLYIESLNRTIQPGSEPRPAQT